MTVRYITMHPRKAISNFLLYALLVAVALVIGLPVLWFLISSIKTESEYIAYPIKFLPKIVQWKNYVDAVTLVDYWGYGLHSLELALIYSILCLITSSAAGFAFSRFRVAGSNVLFGVILAMMIVPGMVTTIPQFIVYSRLHLTNTYWPWVLGGIAGAPFHIFLFRQFFTTIPAQLDEAAEVDGCTPFRVFWQIFLPNSKPVMATSFIFNFSGTWSDWFGPLIYLDDKKTTLAVKINHGYQNAHGNPLMMPTLAAAVIYTLPLILLFFIGQKYIIQGVVTSGIKG
jgi:multiple sugar transport system permease protein